ncbi:hypothetical protein [Undibacterium sp. Ji49W]|uniref:hypothetical protein n=1 Tax=Undibacterium sp. Ji49W TaxID=3413040 RepID=UPI003BF175E8
MAITSFNLAHFAKKRAMALLSNVGSFNSANNVIGKVIFPLFDLMTKEDFETIIKFPTTTGADLPGATQPTAL